MNVSVMCFITFSVYWSGMLLCMNTLSHFSGRVKEVARILRWTHQPLKQQSWRLCPTIRTQLQTYVKVHLLPHLIRTNNFKKKMRPHQLNFSHNSIRENANAIKDCFDRDIIVDIDGRGTPDEVRDNIISCLSNANKNAERV